MIAFKDIQINFEKMKAITASGEEHDIMRLNDLIYFKVGNHWKFWPGMAHSKYKEISPAFEHIVFEKEYSKQVFKLYEEYLIEGILLQ